MSYRRLLFLSTESLLLLCSPTVYWFAYSRRYAHKISTSIQLSAIGLLHLLDCTFVNALKGYIPPRGFKPLVPLEGGFGIQVFSPSCESSPLLILSFMAGYRSTHLVRKAVDV